jgi:hypothetical protein
LLTEIAPSIPVKHVIDESLLRDARAFGITAELEERIHGALTNLMEDAAVVVCTCSTIGGSAEQTVSTNGHPVIRVDRAMAEQAVAMGDRIIVAAALESTLAPTRQLLLEVAEQQGSTLSIHELLCVGAWTHFEQGDQAGYLAAIAATLHEAALVGDVIVLAQASMAGAAALCTDIPIPILSSPRLGLEAALRAYRAIYDEESNDGSRR